MNEREMLELLAELNREGSPAPWSVNESVNPKTIYGLDSARWPVDARLIVAARNHLGRLLSAIAERDAVMTDMMQDGCWAAGRASAFTEALDALRGLRARHLREEEPVKELTLGRVQASHAAIDAVLEKAGVYPGETPALTPPDQLRRDNARLRAALAEIAAVLDNEEQYSAIVSSQRRHMYRIARRALEAT